VHDYDYHMRLLAAGASLVHPLHFRTWRDSGLAFEFRDATYPAPNRSLASAAAGVLVAGRDRNGAEQGRSVRPARVRAGRSAQARAFLTLDAAAARRF
jgi:hypothetical protein